MASIRSTNSPRQTGDAPPVPMATTTSPRLTMAGKMKFERSSPIDTFHRNAQRAGARRQPRVDLVGPPRSPARSRRKYPSRPARRSSRRCGQRSDLRAALALDAGVGREPAHTHSGRTQQLQLRHGLRTEPTRITGPAESARTLEGKPSNETPVDENYFPFKTQNTAMDRKNLSTTAKSKSGHIACVNRAENETIPIALDRRDREFASGALDRWRPTRVLQVIQDWGFEAAVECGASGLCARKDIESWTGSTNSKRKAYIFREAFERLHKLALLCPSARIQRDDLAGAQGLLRRVPFPVMHVDTGKKFPEMYAFRERYSKEWDST